MSFLQKDNVNVRFKEKLYKYIACAIDTQGWIVVVFLLCFFREIMVFCDNFPTIFKIKNAF